VERPSWAPGEIDIARPSIARMYDYLLGGSHNFAADRLAADQALRHMPELVPVMHANRAFLRRAVRFLIAAGVRQFLDLGSGIPTVGNVHEVAHRDDPEARVVYVDIDPVAVAHSQAILADHPGATAIQADLRDPRPLLAHPDLRTFLDLSEPVAVLLVAVLHFVPDQPARLIGHFRDAIAPGSYLVISHASTEGQPPGGIEDARAVYARSAEPVIMRSRAEIAALFDGFTLVEPGLVRLPLWRPDSDVEQETGQHDFPGFAGVARK
jgi:SAM-dependent methyltransferase